MIADSQDTKNHLKNNHLAYIGGPILFTAPHSKKLSRGGSAYGEKKRIHLRQIYTSWLAVQLAHLTRLNKKSPPNSFCVWGKSTQVNEMDMDPNYLLQSMFSTSQFHLSLHDWALKHQGTPILHVDIHGKMNRQNNCDIDVGIRSIQRHWGKDIIIEEMKTYFASICSIFEGLKFREFDCIFNTDPFLHGLWGGKIHTMTQQAIMLGIPSLQLQIPREVRKKLFKDEKLLISFAKGIQGLYTSVIVPYAEKSNRALRIKKELGTKFKVTVSNEKQAEECRKQLKNFESKEELKLNEKRI